MRVAKEIVGKTHMFLRLMQYTDQSEYQHYEPMLNTLVEYHTVILQWMSEKKQTLSLSGLCELIQSLDLAEWRQSSWSCQRLPDHWKYTLMRYALRNPLVSSAMFSEIWN